MSLTNYWEVLKMGIYVNGKNVSEKLFDDPMYNEWGERSKVRSKIIKELGQHLKELYLFLAGITLGLLGSIIANLSNKIIQIQKPFIQIIYYTIVIGMFIYLTMFITKAVRKTKGNIDSFEEEKKSDKKFVFGHLSKRYKKPCMTK